MERSGCQAMLHDNNIPHLKQLCQLFMTRVPLKLQLIRDCISQYIKKVGYEILADQEKTKEKPVIFVENILALKDKFDLIIQTCLQVRRLLLLYLLIPCLPSPHPPPPLGRQNDQKSLRVLKESFEEFMNKDNRTAAFLALFVDDLMKSGSKEMTESEAEDKLDKVRLSPPFPPVSLPSPFPSPVGHCHLPLHQRQRCVRSLLQKLPCQEIALWKRFITFISLSLSPPPSPHGTQESTMTWNEQ
jgi:hypothetical protein